MHRLLTESQAKQIEVVLAHDRLTGQGRRAWDLKIIHHHRQLEADDDFPGL